MNLEICVKLGGSLFNTPDKVNSIVEILVHHAGKVILVNGSGSLGDICGEFWRSNHLRLNPVQKRLLLARVRATISVLLEAFHPSLTLVDTVIQARESARAGKIPIADPLTLLYTLIDTEPFIGSDVFAAELCRMMNLKLLLIITNVDGEKSSLDSNEIFNEISTLELQNIGKSCLDSGIEKSLESGHIECVVLNGLYPERIQHFLQTGSVTVGTRIMSNIE